MLKISLVLLLVMSFEASAGEVVVCASTHGKGRWVYRDVDGRKCWFPAGRLRRGQEKPLEELQWPFTVGSPPSRVFQPASAASWVVEERWLEAPYEFVDAKGWSHKE